MLTEGYFKRIISVLIEGMDIRVLESILSFTESFCSLKKVNHLRDTTCKSLSILLS